MCKAARGQTENQAKQSHGPVDGRSSEPEGKKPSRQTEREGRRQKNWKTKIRQRHTPLRRVTRRTYSKPFKIKEEATNSLYSTPPCVPTHSMLVTGSQVKTVQNSKTQNIDCIAKIS